MLSEKDMPDYLRGTATGAAILAEKAAGHDSKRAEAAARLAEFDASIEARRVKLREEIAELERKEKDLAKQAAKVQNPFIVKLHVVQVLLEEREAELKSLRVLASDDLPPWLCDAMTRERNQLVLELRRNPSAAWRQADAELAALIAEWENPGLRHRSTRPVVEAQRASVQARQSLFALLSDPECDAKIPALVAGLKAALATCQAALEGMQRSGQALPAMPR